MCPYLRKMKVQMLAYCILLLVSGNEFILKRPNFLHFWNWNVMTGALPFDHNWGEGCIKPPWQPVDQQTFPRWSPLKKVFSAWYNSDPQASTDAAFLVLGETTWCWPVTVICLPVYSSCTLVNITCQKMILFCFFLNRRKEGIRHITLCAWGNSVSQQK